MAISLQCYKKEVFVIHEIVWTKDIIYFHYCQLGFGDTRARKKLIFSFRLYWTSPGGSTSQSSSCTATYDPSRKQSKLDELDMQNTAGEVGASSKVMHSCGPLHMVEQRQDDLFEPTYNSSVLIQDVALKADRKWWTIGRVGERGSGRSMLIARLDDDDDDGLSQ